MTVEEIIEYYETIEPPTDIIRELIIEIRRLRSLERPKQKYDEKKRLRIENQLRKEQRAKDKMDKDEEMEALVVSIGTSLQRIADVMELWADLQKESADN